MIHKPARRVYQLYTVGFTPGIFGLHVPAHVVQVCLEKWNLVALIKRPRICNHSMNHSQKKLGTLTNGSAFEEAVFRSLLFFSTSTDKMAVLSAPTVTNTSMLSLV